MFGPLYSTAICTKPPIAAVSLGVACIQRMVNDLDYFVCFPDLKTSSAKLVITAVQ